MRLSSGAEVTTRPEFDDRLTADRTKIDALARLVLFRTAVTDAKGEAILPALLGPQRVEVAHEGRIAPPWIGRAPANITLDLSQSFQLSGRVTATNNAQLEPSIVVTYMTRVHKYEHSLGQCPVRPDGTFGPISVPILPTDQYVFQVRGGSIAMTESARTPPHPGESVQLEFRVEPGIPAVIRVVDRGGSAIPGAQVSIHWQEESTWRRIAGLTDAKGLVRFENARASWLWIRARRTGFVPMLRESFEFGAESQQPILVTLERAGTITGRCTHAGKPVEDFTVSFRKGDLSTAVEFPVSGSPDGRFRIDEAPLGIVSLFAFSEAYPRGRTQEVTVGALEPVEVELELPTAHQAKGRAVDSADGEPVTSALVRTWVAEQGMRIEPWGPSVPVDPQGAFVVDGIGDEEALVMLEAPGYASKVVVARKRPEQIVDLGVLGLTRKRSIQVKLTSPIETDFTQYAIELFGATSFPEQRLPGEGVVTFSDLEPSHYSIRIVCPDSSVIQESFRLLGSRDLVAEYEVGGRSLEVVVVPEAGGPQHPATWLSVTYTTATSRSQRQFLPIPPENTVRVGNIASDHAMIAALTDDDRPIGMTAVTLGATSPARVEIPISRSARVFRLLGPDRSPASSATVRLRADGDTTGWIDVLDSDASGEFTVKGYPYDRIVVHAWHSKWGVLTGRIVDLKREVRDPIEITMQADLELRVRVHERGQPVPAVDPYAEDLFGMTPGLQDAPTDDNGIATWRPVDRGGYRISLNHPSYWPVTITHELAPGQPPVDMEVRRLGGVDVVVRNKYGNPVAGVELDLRSDEMKEWVSSWIARGLVSAPGSGCRSDAEGKLSLSGLPNGPYHWRATIGAEVREGTLVVPPMARGQAEVRLD